MDESEDSGYLTNDEVRRRRLTQLALQTEGGLKAIADAAKVNAQNLDHILKRRRQGTARADGTKPLVAMGDKVARDIERALHLTPGWLDWPFENVDFDTFSKLGSTQQLIVEVKMSDAVKDQASKKSAVRHIDKKPVSNKKVEQHYRALPEGAAEAAFLKASARVRVTRPDPHNDLFTEGKSPKD